MIYHSNWANLGICNKTYLVVDMKWYPDANKGSEDVGAGNIAKMQVEIMKSQPLIT